VTGVDLRILFDQGTIVEGHAVDLFNANGPTCPFGSEVWSGGFYVAGKAYSQATELSSYPSEIKAPSWRAWLYSPAILGQEGTLQVEALCATVIHGGSTDRPVTGFRTKLDTRVVALPTGTAPDVSIGCKEKGYYLVGGGYSISNLASVTGDLPEPAVHRGGRFRWLVSVYNGGVGATKGQLRVFAVCVQLQRARGRPTVSFLSSYTEWDEWEMPSSLGGHVWAVHEVGCDPGDRVLSGGWGYELPTKDSPLPSPPFPQAYASGPLKDGDGWGVGVVEPPFTTEAKYVAWAVCLTEER
jgi:hypothetical protein